MPTEFVKKYVRTKDLPLGWQKEMQAESNRLYTVTIREMEGVEYDVDGTPMPPESQIKEECIKAVEASEEDVRQGRVKSFKDVDELFTHLDNL